MVDTNPVMTNDEIMNALTEVAGIPPPPFKAPAEQWDQWAVASFVLAFCRDVGDPEEGKRQAGEFLRTGCPAWWPQLEPHYARTLGAANAGQ